MTLKEYQDAARQTSRYNFRDGIPYLSLGLVGEAGEVANIVKRIYRDEKISVENVRDELGDVLWYVSELANYLGLNLEDVARLNLAKLQERHGK